MQPREARRRLARGWEGPHGSSLPYSVIDLPADVRRAVFALFGLAVLCVVMAGLYTNLYLFTGPLGESLPEVSPTSADLTLAFQISAALAVGWALVLVVLATPTVAAPLRDSLSRLAASRRIWLVAVGAAGAYTAARFAFTIETIHATLEMYTDGTALLPFQYRALVPWLVRALVEVAPPLGALDIRALYAPFEALAAVAVWAAFAYLLRVLGLAPGASRVAALGVFVPLAFNLAAPWRYNPVYFPYDTPSVAFFTLGLALLLDGRMRPYYALFVVATLNRETTCFLTMAYLALAVGRERPARILGHVGAQLVLWVALKAALGWLYADNVPLDAEDGALFVTMIGRSARILMSVPGLVYVGFVTMGGAAAAALLLARRAGDARLARIAWIVPPFLFGMSIVGEMAEVRIYSELVPLVAATLVLALRSVVREAADAAPAAEPVLTAA